MPKPRMWITPVCLWSKLRHRDTHDPVSWTATRPRTLQQQVRVLRVGAPHLRELDDRIMNFRLQQLPTRRGLHLLMSNDTDFDGACLGGAVLRD